MTRYKSRAKNDLSHDLCNLLVYTSLNPYIHTTLLNSSNTELDGSRRKPNCLSSLYNTNPDATPVISASTSPLVAPPSPQTKQHAIPVHAAHNLFLLILDILFLRLTPLAAINSKHLPWRLAGLAQKTQTTPTKRAKLEFIQHLASHQQLFTLPSCP